MTLRGRLLRTLVGVALAVAPVTVLAQFTRPNVIATVGDVTTTLGATVFINHGLVGVGRLPASDTDSFGESFGSVSSLQITDWTNLGTGSYAGTFNILPDRGYNSGAFFADYAARIQQVPFVFTPYTGAGGIGGSTVPERMAAQNQIVFTGGTSTGVRFTYLDPSSGSLSLTTGLEPNTGSTPLFGKTVPYVKSYTGLDQPGGTSRTYTGINKLALDSEALIVKADGSGYVGDEYGPYLYYFNASKQIIGVIVPPKALVPFPTAVLGGSPNFGATAPQASGRRINQGMEGVSLSPDGTRLFALLQSAAIQDSSAGNAANRKQTRLLVYDVSSNPTPDAPILEYALTLPTYTGLGDGGAVNATAAQSEVVALDNFRLLVLSRDGNGLGSVALSPSVVKSILLVDTRVGNPTDFAGSGRDGEGGKITSASGVLDASLTALSRVEAVNMLNSAQLNKFNILLDTGSGQVSQLTLGEKWEGLSLVPASDPSRPDDYFLFIANDNDFLTSSGFMRGPGAGVSGTVVPYTGGTIVPYNGFPPSPPTSGGSPAYRLPANAPGGGANANDTMFLVFRVTIAATPQVSQGGFLYNRATRQFSQQATITNTTGSSLTGPIYLALDGLSPNATLTGASGVTVNHAPAGSPYVTVVGSSGALAAGESVSVTLSFSNATTAAITYTNRVLVLTTGTTP